MVRHVNTADKSNEVNEGRFHGSVLIVEDNLTLRSVLVKRIGQVASEVIEADNGQEAWDIIRSRKPDLVLTDLMMPNLSGEELCALVRKNPETRQTYLIMLTGKKGVANVVKGLELGADDYLEKPFNTSELLARVKVGLRIRSLQREFAKVHKLSTIGWVTEAICHEINNPLSVISSNAQYLKSVTNKLAQKEQRASFDKVQTTELLDIFGEITDMVNRAANAIKNLRSFTSERPPHRQQVKISTLRQSAGKLLLEAGWEDISDSGWEGDDLTVYCAPQEIAVAISETYKRVQMTKSTAEKPIATRTNNTVVLTIAVRSTENLPPPLEPQLVDLAPGEKRSGLDIGLSHVQWLLRRQGGDVAVTAKENGYSVEITLPAEE